MRIRPSLTIAAALSLTGALIAGCGPTQTAPDDAPSTDAAGGAAGLPVNGQCVLIPTQRAAQLLGATPTSTAADLSGDDGDDDAPAAVHVDGCTHTSPAGNLGYAVNDYTGTGVGAATIVTEASAMVGEAPGAQEFDVPGGDVAVGFTMPIGPKVMARISIAKGSYTIDVNAVLADGAKAEQIALDAAAILVAAVG